MAFASGQIWKILGLFDEFEKSVWWLWKICATDLKNSWPSCPGDIVGSEHAHRKLPKRKMMKRHVANSKRRVVPKMVGKLATNRSIWWSLIAHQKFTVQYTMDSKNLFILFNHTSIFVLWNKEIRSNWTNYFECTLMKKVFTFAYFTADKVI